MNTSGMSQYVGWLRSYLSDDHLGLWVALSYAQDAINAGALEGAAPLLAYEALSALLESGEIVAGHPASDGYHFVVDPRSLSDVLLDLKASLATTPPPNIGEGLWLSLPMRVTR
jgi:hypothetical protein